MNVTDVGVEGKLLFGWLDCVLFGMLLGVSSLIGVYFGFCGKKNDTPEEYLMGGKTMSTLPVAVSLVASSISGITVMGVPAEIYKYGTLYWYISFCAPFVGMINYYLYLPVFYELQLTSVYEYLELRFNQSVRVMASVLCTISMLLYMPIVVYVPALALSQVTGMNLHYITPAISLICIFYTMLGGIKAVVWTDFLQGLVMVVSSFIVIILGLIHVGGFRSVLERNLEGGRIRELELNTSPYERMSLWSIMLGGITIWLGGVSVNQAMVQRFLSLATFKKVKRAMIYFVLGLVLIKTITCFIGLLIFATYHDCDPLQAKMILRTDQLLAYYVLDIGAAVPGLPGLFVAGVFSAALSTMSTGLNSLGATLFEDFVRPCLKLKLSEKGAKTVIKIIIIIIGSICVVMVFVVDKMGGIWELTVSVSGITSGAMMGLFTFGMFYPRANSKGAIIGSISCLLIMGWIVSGNQMAIASGTFKYKSLSTSVEGCRINNTVSEPPMSEVPEAEAFALFRVTFMYYTLMGLIIVFAVGTPVSLLTEAPKLEDLNPAVFSPIVRKYLLKEKTNLEMKERRPADVLKISSPE